jgi:hypothetical protein
MPWAAHIEAGERGTRYSEHYLNRVREQKILAPEKISE